MEAADAGIKTCVAIVDGIPSHDMIKIKRYMRRYTKSGKMTLVGPNCAGIISPGKSMLGIMPGHIYKEGRVGIISRSGTLGYEAAQQLKNLNIGVSTSVGIGGDPINGSSFRDIIEKFENDDETDAVLMIGEIGGPQEVAAGHFAKENMKKPVIAYIAGLTAPKGRVMGHAGAIVSAYGESAIEKVEILKECGITISKNPSVMGDTVKSVLDKKVNMVYDDNNIFAKIIRGEIPCNKIYEDEYVLSFHDINPQKKIHALVIPKGKYIDLDDFNKNASNDEIVGLIKGITLVAKKLNISIDKGRGYRTLANISEHGGQEVPHLHFHIFGGEKVGRMVE